MGRRSGCGCANDEPTEIVVADCKAQRSSLLAFLNAFGFDEPIEFFFKDDTDTAVPMRVANPSINDCFLTGIIDTFDGPRWIDIRTIAMVGSGGSG